MRVAFIAGFFLVGSVTAVTAADTFYNVVESKSTVRIHVGKSGLFSFAGHLHEVQAPVAGTINADPANLAASSVDLTFASARMVVVPEGEPAGDAPKVEEVMRGPSVLDVLRFPDIRFRSKTVGGRLVSPGIYELNLGGDLTLHGVSREITVPLKVTIDGSTLIATGQTTLRHDQFGMKPVTAGGGTVKVANEIRIDFRIVAERR